MKMLFIENRMVYNKGTINRMEEHVMGTWDDLKGSLFAAGRDVSQKAKEVSEMAKIKMDIRTKEDFIEKQFASLGRAYYEANKDAAAADDVEQFAVIKEAIDEIARMEQQLLDIQGVVLCPNCGKKSPIGTSFCSDCGSKLDDIVVDATVVSEEPVAEEMFEEEPVEAAEEVVVEEVVEETTEE